MRIVTWNMNVIGKDRARQHDQAWIFLLETVNPDIALLQETTIPPYLPPEYRHPLFTPGLPGKRWGSAILSRIGDLTLKWENNSRGAVLAATSSIPGVGGVTLASLQARVPVVGGVIRPLRETFDVLRTHLGERFVVGGDFNSARQAHLAWPSYGHGQFWKDIETWGFKELLPMGGREQQSYWGNWLLDQPPTLGNTLQDDHVLLDAETFALVQSCQVWDTKLARELSDHGPIVVDVALPNESLVPDTVHLDPQPANNGVMSIADELRNLSAHKKLVRAADLGFICKLRCEMPVCFYPDSAPPKGYYPLPNPTSEGRRMFLPNDGRNPWGPTADHYPLLEYQGGTLIPENIRLAHKLCNSEDYWRNPMHAEIRAERAKANLGP